MRFPRRAGILLHLTSLPGPFGIGDLGPESLRFADFLSASGMKLWQILPLNPSGAGNCPYSSSSAFAGNPLLISLEDLAGEGLLEKRELATAPAFPADRVDFGRVIPFRVGLLKRAFRRFSFGAGESERRLFNSFREAHSNWLKDYSLFVALREELSWRPWPRWPPSLVRRDPAALERARSRLADRIGEIEFGQYLFYRQWTRFRRRSQPGPPGKPEPSPVPASPANPPRPGLGEPALRLGENAPGRV